MPGAPIRFPGLLKPTSGAGAARQLGAVVFQRALIGTATPSAATLASMSLQLPTAARFAVVAASGTGGVSYYGSPGFGNSYWAGGGARAVTYLPLKPGAGPLTIGYFQGPTSSYGYGVRDQTGVLVCFGENGTDATSSSPGVGGSAANGVGSARVDGLAGYGPFVSPSTSPRWTFLPAVPPMIAGAGVLDLTSAPAFDADNSAGVTSACQTAVIPGSVIASQNQPYDTGLAAVEFWTADPRGTAV